MHSVRALCDARYCLLMLSQRRINAIYGADPLHSTPGEHMDCQMTNQVYTHRNGGADRVPIGGFMVPRLIFGVLYWT